MKLKRVMEMMDFPVRHNAEGETLNLQDICPKGALNISLNSALYRFREVIEAWAKVYMPQVNVMERISDFESIPTQEYKHELTELISSLTPFRQSVTVEIAREAFAYAYGREHWHTYLLELIDAHLFKGIEEYKITPQDVHVLWTDSVYEEAYVNFDRYNFGNLDLPRLVNRSRLNHCSPKLVAGKLKSLRAQLVKDHIRQGFRPLYRMLDEIAAQIAEDIRYSLNEHSRYAYIALTHNANANSVMAINYGDMRCLKHNLTNGIYSAE